MNQCSEALLLYRGSRICVGSLVTYVCVCGGITSLGFSVDWTSSSLSPVDLSGLSWHRSCPGHLWEAAVVWAPTYSAVYLFLCLAIKRRVLQHRVIFFTPWKISWTDYASRKNSAQAIFLEVSYYTQNRERHSARRTNNLHNPICRPKSTPRSYAPECFTHSSSVPNVQPKAQVISPGPRSKRVDSLGPPAES